VSGGECRDDIEMETELKTPLAKSSSMEEKEEEEGGQKPQVSTSSSSSDNLAKKLAKTFGLVDKTSASGVGGDDDKRAQEVYLLSDVSGGQGDDFLEDS